MENKPLFYCLCFGVSNGECTSLTKMSDSKSYPILKKQWTKYSREGHGSCCLVQASNYVSRIWLFKNTDFARANGVHKNRPVARNLEGGLCGIRCVICLCSLVPKPHSSVCVHNIIYTWAKDWRSLIGLCVLLQTEMEVRMGKSWKWG